MKLQRIFEPTRIGSMILRNRIVMPAMETNFGTVDGYVTTKLIDCSRCGHLTGSQVLYCHTFCLTDGDVTSILFNNMNRFNARGSKCFLTETIDFHPSIINTRAAEFLAVSINVFYYLRSYMRSFLCLPCYPA